jgi:hypothetical protein
MYRLREYMWAKEVEISPKDTKNILEPSEITVAHQNSHSTSTTTYIWTHRRHHANIVLPE